MSDEPIKHPRDLNNDSKVMELILTMDAAFIDDLMTIAKVNGVSLCDQVRLWAKQAARELMDR